MAQTWALQSIVCRKERPKLLPRASPELVGCESEGGWGGGGEGALSVQRGEFSTGFFPAESRRNTSPYALKFPREPGAASALS